MCIKPEFEYSDLKKDTIATGQNFFKVLFKHFNCGTLTTSERVNFFMPLQGGIAIPIYSQWEMEAQKDVPKTVAPTMNLKPAIPIAYASLLKSKYNCVNAPVTFTLGVRERSILCLTGKRSFTTR